MGTFKSESRSGSDFKCESGRSVRNGECNVNREGEWGQDVIITIINNIGESLKNIKYTITGPDGKEKNGDTGENGKIEEKNLIPGKYKVGFTNK